jgi:hypothetical protein
MSSLVFHQVPLEEKRAGLAAIHETLTSGGSLHFAYYGLQRTPKMRKRFRIVQKGDGSDNTEPDAQGVLPELMADLGFDKCRRDPCVRDRLRIDLDLSRSAPIA